MSLNTLTAAWLAQLVKRQSAVREVEDSSPRVLKYLRRMYCLCNYLQMVRRSSQIVARVAYIFSVTWIAGDVKEPTHLARRVGHVIPGIVVWPCLLGRCFTES